MLKPTLNSADVDLLVNRFILIFATKADLNKTENRLNQKYDKNMNRVDQAIGELKAKREEQTVHSDQHRQINDTLDSHQKRLRLIETTLTQPITS